MAQLLGDQTLDRVMMVVVRLARELYVTRDRLQVLEELLQQHGALAPGAIDDFKPDSQLTARLDSARDAFIQDILEPLTHSRAVD